MNHLTATAIRSIKANGKIQNLNDGGGLYLRVSSTGKASWRVEYAFGGKRLSKTLGLYPTMLLADARRERDRIKSDIAGGVVPVVGNPTSGSRTLGELGAEHFTIIRKSGISRKTLDRHVWLIDKLAVPLHHRQIANIKPLDILTVLREIADSGRRDSALRLRAVLRIIFDRAIIAGEIDANPVAPLGKSLPPANTKNHPAVTDEREFGKLILKIDSVALPTNRHALQFMALCYARPGETRRAAWNQIDWEKSQWIVPAEIMKMSREHVIPLSRQALDILKRQREISGDGHFIFRNSVGNGIMSPATLNKVLERLGYGTPHHVPHGFRSSASTILNERGWRYDVIEASLAHVEGNAVRRAYNRALYVKERTEMAQAWADLCDQLRSQANREAEIESFL